MKYKVLKEIPGVKSGTILIKNNGGYYFTYSDNTYYKHGMIEYDEEYLKAHPTFFKNIKGE